MARKPLSGVPGKQAEGEFQAWLGHQGELGLEREKDAMGLQENPPSQQGGGGEGQASMGAQCLPECS